MYTFGPVASRRLGRSLGIDPFSAKTCNFDCLYCEVGKAPPQMAQYNPPLVKDIISEVKEKIATSPDWLTITGTGEPTIYPFFPELVRKLKDTFNKPVALITNSTNLLKKDIQKSLQYIDLIMPSLDAADDDTFKKINRPDQPISCQTIINGLNHLDKNYRGKVWLEIFLLKGVNDSPESLQKIAETACSFNFDKILLNTVARPPAYSIAKALSYEEMIKVADFFRGRATVISKPAINQQSLNKVSEEIILEFIKRRPADIDDLTKGLGVLQSSLENTLKILIEKKLIYPELLQGKIFYKSS